MTNTTEKSLLDRARSVYEWERELVAKSDEERTVKAVAELKRILGDVEVTAVSPTDRRIVVRDGERVFELAYEYIADGYVFYVVGECPVCHKRVVGDTMVTGLSSFYRAVTEWEPDFSHMMKHKRDDENARRMELESRIRRFLDSTARDDYEFRGALISALALIYDQLETLNENIAGMVE